MTTAAVLRQRAAECEQLADLAGAAPVAESLRMLARQYLSRAVQLEEAGTHVASSAAPHMPQR